MAALWLLAGVAAAQTGGRVVATDYAALEAELTGRLDFEAFGAGAEPGLPVAEVIVAPGVTLGERLTGTGRADELRDGVRFDAFGPGAPSRPLTVTAGPAGENLSVAQHRGFGSAALFPLGPEGWPALSARGEGMVAFVFDTDQAAVGLKLHADYPDPLGSRPPPGPVDLLFYDRAGQVLGFARVSPVPGVNALAYRTLPGAPGIAAFAIANRDPGGIALDDVIFRLPDLTG